jgi:hypothetical protein
MIVVVIITWFRKIACWMIGADGELGAPRAGQPLLIVITTEYWLSERWTGVKLSPAKYRVTSAVLHKKVKLDDKSWPLSCFCSLDWSQRKLKELMICDIDPD